MPALDVILAEKEKFRFAFEGIGIKIDQKA